MLTTVRASALPLAFACRGSLEPIKLAIKHVNPEARLGTAAHLVMQHIAEQDLHSIEAPWLAAIAHDHEVDVEDLRMLAYNGLRIWFKLRQSFRDPIGELDLSAEVNGIVVTGHGDLVAIDRPRRRLNGTDWKFGRVDRDHSEQARCYCALCLLSMPDIDEVYWPIAWMRDEIIEHYSMTRDELPGWLERFEDRIAKWDQVYRPNDQCQHCPRSHECPALTAMVRRDVAALMGPELVARIQTGLRDLPAAQVIELHRRASTIAALCETLGDAIKVHVREAGGAVAGPLGTLAFASSERRKLKPQEAWPVVTKALTDDELASVVTLHPGKIDKLIATKAGKGKGAGAVRKLAEQLETAGAVEKVHSEALKFYPTRGDKP